MGSEQRRATRHTVWFGAEVSAEETDTLAIGRNISECGLLVASAAALEEGAMVTVSLKIPGDELEKRVIQGRIVRVERNSEDADGTWRHRLAVEFDVPIPGLERALDHLARQSLAS